MKKGGEGMNQPNAFKQVWDEIVSPETLPRRFRQVHEIGYEEFRRKVLAQDPTFVQTAPRNLYAGDTYFIRGAFPRDFMVSLKHRAFEDGRRHPSSFHKVLEGCPDFNRKITEDLSDKYSFKYLKHSWYFFPWNDDPLKIFQPVWERWSLIKFLSGQQLDEYAHHTPKDGVVDRIQIVRYPAGSGMLEPHSDPYLHQPLIISAYMSKRGEDFETGGFYMVGPGDQCIDMEDQIEVGDMCIAYATVAHGVEVVDGHKSVNWDSMDGRWFLGLYSMASDEVSSRHTGQAVKLTSRR